MEHPDSKQIISECIDDLSSGKTTRIRNYLASVATLPHMSASEKSTLTQTLKFLIFLHEELTYEEKNLIALLEHADRLILCKYHDQPEGDREAITVLARSLHPQYPKVSRAALTFVARTRDTEAITTQQDLPELDSVDEVVEIMKDQYEILHSVCYSVLSRS